MYDLWLVISGFLAIVCLLVGTVYLLVSSPCFVYNLLLLARGSDYDAQQNWKLFRWNVADIWLFSRAPKDRVESRREKAAKWLLRGLVGVVTGLAAFALSFQHPWLN